MRAMPSRSAAAFIALVALAAVVNFAYSFATPLIGVVLDGHRSRSWPQVEGQVVRTAVEVDRKGRAHSVVTYAYAVSGVSYQSSRVQIVGAAEDEAQARRLAAQYANQRVKVFYKPSNPEEAVLVPGPGSNIPLVILAGGLLVVVGGAGALLRVLVRAVRAGGANGKA